MNPPALNLSTASPITWCPGCPNNAILVAFRAAITELCASGASRAENFAAVAGIGCHGKITDYLNINTFECLHGRAIPTATGMKIANPDLDVAVFSGDGDSYSEGLNHLLHAAARNVDITVFIHDNQVFALTTGQSTATSPKGYKGNSRPEGSVEDPFRPLPLLLAAGASFVARTYAGDIAFTKEIMKAAIAHKGFAFVDIIQPCITFLDTRDYYKERLERIPETEPKDDSARALALALQDGERFPVGIFYQAELPVFETTIRGA